MKQRIINGHALEFFDSSNTKKGEIKISGSDIIINPLDGNGTVIFGEQGTVNDIEVGAVGTPVDFTFAGGGTITSNGGTLTIGNTGDTIDLSNATIGAITASAFVGGTFEGDGAGLTGVVPDLSSYNGNVVVTGSSTVTGNIFTEGALLLDGVDGLYLNHGGSSVFSPSPGIFYSGTSGQGWYFQVPNNGQEKFSFKLGSTDANREFRVIDPSWNPLFQVQGTGDAVIANNLTVGGIVTAQEFHTEFVSASIVYQSGSTKFGDTADDVHQFTGSTHIQSGSYKIDTYGEGLRWYDGTNYNANRIQLSSAQNMQLQAGGVIQLQSSTQIVNGNELTFNNSGNTTRFDINNAGASGEYRLDFSSGSTQLMVISGSGNVGIGTTAPNERLEVAGNIRLQNSGRVYLWQNNNNSYIDYANWIASTGNSQVIQNTGAGGITFKTLTIARMFISSSGDIGIGTTTPTKKLDVRGSMLISGSFSGTDANALVLNNTDSSGNPSIMRMIFSGEGGNEALQIGMYSSPTVKPVYFQSTQGSGWGNIVFQNNGGSVGIGTDSPTQKLDVNGNIKATKLLLNTTNTGYTLYSAGESRINGVIFQQASSVDYLQKSSGTGDFYVRNSVSGQRILVGAANSSGQFTNYLEVDGANNDATIRTNDVDRLYISSSGNVGIGTTSPGTKLDVADSEPIIRLTDTRNLNVGDWDDISLGRIQFYTSDTTSPGPRALSEIEAYSGPGAASGPEAELRFKTSTINDSSPVQRMVIDAEGRLGLGTTNPGDTFQIHDNTTTSNPKILIYGYDTATTSAKYGQMFVGTDGSFNISAQDTYLILGAGNYIQSNTTHAFLQGILQSNNKGISMQNSQGSYKTVLITDSSNIVKVGGVGTGWTTGGDLALYSSGSEKVRIDTSGNVGIGTTSPLSWTKLHVNGHIYTDDAVTSDGYLRVRGAGQQDAVIISGTARSYFNGGNVGIGTTTPSASLHVSGAADVMLIEGSGSTANTSIFAIDGNNGRLFEVSDDLSDSLFSVNTIAGLPVMEVFSDNRVTMGAFNQNDLVISGSKVGIGTATPSRKLHVDGDIQIGQNATIWATNTTGNNVRLLDLDAQNNIEIGLGGGHNSFNYNNQFFVSSAGSVGIGTYSPSIKLHISGSTGADSGIRQSRAGVKIWDQQIDSSGRLIWSHYASEGGTANQLFTLDDSNYVGIGTTSPDSLLEIYSDSTTDFLKLTSGGTSASPIKLIFEKTTAEQGIIEYNRNGDLEIYNTDGDGGVMLNGRNSEAGDLYVADGGNVGVGTTTPSQKLEVRDGNLIVSSSNSEIALGPASGKSRIFTNSTKDIRFSTATTDDVLFLKNSNGNVGIGTTSPSEKLQVNGNVAISGSNATLQLREGSAELYKLTAGGTSLDMTVDSTNAISIYQNGSVGIGTTSPSTKLHVATSTSGGDPSVIIQDSSRGQTGTLNYVSFTEANGNSQAKFGFQSTLNGTFTFANLIGDVDITSTGQVRAIASSNFIVQTAGSPHFIVNNSGDVGIGTTSPSNKLDVVGTISGSDINIDGWGSVSASLAAAGGGGAAFPHTGEAIISGSGNTSSTNALNIVNSDGSLLLKVQDDGVVFSNGPSHNASSTVFGEYAGNASAGSDNTIFGFGAGQNYQGATSTLIGRGAGQNLNSTSYNTVMIGYEAGRNATADSDNAVYVGYSAGYQGDGIHQIGIGTSAAYSSSVDYVVALGYAAGYQSTSPQNSVFIGREAGYDQFQGADEVMMGYRAGQYAITNGDNVMIGTLAGQNTTGYTRESVFIGDSAGQNNTGMISSIAIGNYAGGNADGNYSVLIGPSAGWSSLANENVAIGYNTLAYSTTSGFQNVALGTDSMYIVSSSKNVAIGYKAAALGETNNTYGLNGTNNTFLGANTNYSSTNLTITNATAVGANTIVTDSNTVILGNNAKIGIGTSSPAHTLDVVQLADNQGIRLVGYDDQSSRTYLQYVDQNGHISLVASSGANLNYTVQNGHFNVNLNTSTKDFRVKDSGGSTVLNVTGDSKVGIGLTAPVETLHLSGSMRIDGAGTGTVQEQPGSPDTAYTNSSETNFYMGAPDRYLKIVLDGTTYLIPAYTPA